eukprot:Lithocolla_globosa_v1_NODE_2152_length_2134_cov_10.702690.p1 type:complete len:523 gc:universal NODE_2152_length_2134_cov_10.702690:1943-375(-)
MDEFPTTPNFLTQKSFDLLLQNPNAINLFQDFLRFKRAEENLLFYQAVKRLKRSFSVDTAANIRDVFLLEDSPFRINVDDSELRTVLDSFQTNRITSSVMDGLLNEVLKVMFTNFYDEFAVDLKKRAAVAVAKLQMLENSTSLNGLADCFSLADMRQPIQPLVAISGGFTAVTGYKRNEIINKNCRFLQGPDTTKQSVRSIRSAISSQKPTTQLLLNYRKDGTPFWNLLYLCPLFDEEQKLEFFFGGQVDVTKSVCKDLPLAELINAVYESDKYTREPIIKSPRASLSRKLSFLSPRNTFSSTSPQNSIRSSQSFSSSSRRSSSDHSTDMTLQVPQPQNYSSSENATKPKLRKRMSFNGGSRPLLPLPVRIQLSSLKPSCQHEEHSSGTTGCISVQEEKKNLQVTYANFLLLEFPHWNIRHASDGLLTSLGYKMQDIRNRPIDILIQQESVMKTIKIALKRQNPGFCLKAIVIPTNKLGFESTMYFTPLYGESTDVMFYCVVMEFAFASSVQSIPRTRSSFW